MSEASLPADERVRHWIVEAAIGAGAALAAITVAEAALPDRAQAVAWKPSQRVAAAPPTTATSSEPYLIAFSDPVQGREVVSPYGLRQLPWEENGRLHEGVDIAAPLGSPVLAAADGVVLETGRSFSYGRYVKVRHAEDLTTLYAHMGAVGPGMTVGRAVKAGTPVGRIGSSGTSTGPHLHFELRDASGRPLNPGLFLGEQFATADELPLKAGRRVPRGVRIAWVSRIPQSKRELMQARLDARNGGDAQPAGGRSVTVYYGDGRAHAQFQVGRAKPLPAGAEVEDPDGSAGAPPV